MRQLEGSERLLVVAQLREGCRELQPVDLLGEARDQLLEHLHDLRVRLALEVERQQQLEPGLARLRALRDAPLGPTQRGVAVLELEVGARQGEVRGRSGVLGVAEPALEGFDALRVVPRGDVELAEVVAGVELRGGRERLRGERLLEGQGGLREVLPARVYVSVGLVQESVFVGVATLRRGEPVELREGLFVALLGDELVRGVEVAESLLADGQHLAGARLLLLLGRRRRRSHRAPDGEHQHEDEQGPSHVSAPSGS